MRTATLPPPVAPDLPALRRGDADAIAWAYREYAGHLLHSATALLGDRATAEDLVHDLFVGLPETLRRYQEHGQFGAWLSRVAIRMALMRLRAMRRRSEVGFDAVAEPARRAEGDGLADRLLIEGALAGLAEDARTVVVLRDLEGWSYRDIADFVGASEGTVMTRHCRAMRRLKTALEGSR